MAVKNYKLKKGQWKDQVINPGIDKNLPVGFVDVIYNPDGSMAGFLRGKTFYNPGEVVPEVDKGPSRGQLETAAGKANVKLMNAKEDFKKAKQGTPEYEAALAKVTQYTDELNSARDAIKQKEAADKKAAEVKTAKESGKQAGTDLEQAQKDLALAKASGDKAGAVKAQQAIDMANANIMVSQVEAGVKPKGTKIVPGEKAAAPAVGPTAKADAKTTAATNSSSSKAGANKSGVIIPTADEAHTTAVTALQSLGDMGQYAVTMGLIESDPSLKDIFYRDVYLPISQGKQPVAINKFQADIQNSKWFASYIEPAREAEAIKYGDPATWEASMQSATQIVAKAAMNAGYDLSTDQINQIADQALHKAGGKAQAITGLIATEMNAQITATGKINPKGGTAASSLAELKTFAGNYMVQNLYTDADLTGFADQIAKGTTTLAAVQNEMKSKAKVAYGSLAGQIDAGLQPKDIVAPNITRIASILEMNPNDINPTDPRWAKMIFQQDAKDPSVQTIKPYWQSEQDAMKDPNWAYTKNARSSLDNVAHNVLVNLGLAY